MKRFLVAFLLIVIVVCGAAVGALATFDIDAHRQMILQKLSEETGRTVHLNGPIRLEIALDGISLRLEDGSISNPPWASRPDMAGVGHFELRIAPLPLLHHKLIVTALSIVNADILLESKANQAPNWDLSGAMRKGQRAPASTDSLDLSSPDVAIAIEQLSVKDSQLAFKVDAGNITVFKTKTLTLLQSADATRLKFNGLFNDQPLSLNAVTNADDLTSPLSRPLTLDAAYGLTTVTADGHLNLHDDSIDLSQLSCSSGKTTISGNLRVQFNAARPTFDGSLFVDQLVSSNSKVSPEPEPGQDNMAASETTLLLDDKAFDLSALKTFDATLKLAVGKIAVGLTALTAVQSKILLSNGNLFISPLTADLGSGTITAQIHVDSQSEPPIVGLSFSASGINLSDLFDAGGLEALLSGKVETDANLVTSGHSVHALGSHLSGSFNLVGAGGNVINRASNKIIGGLAAMLLSGSDDGHDALNCLVARFTASNGVVRDNGIILDTSEATVSGRGGFDLRDEAIDLSLRAKPKTLVSVDVLPPFHIGGTFRHPSYNVDTGAIFQNVAGLITGDQPIDAVPTLTAVQGQNACLLALNHGTGDAPLAPTSGVVQQLSGKAGALLKGIMGQ